ncbi:hypothetical protein FF38_09066 [Lucilia cuprina]|uniref:Uncharacterized protein n=1 Tax=Lucilia cuprina TaxID=7375 RepID=A0A0L0BVC0_LUCCU|nr:hypothetical protein FF38_09066 [Lucilia cuprina]
MACCDFSQYSNGSSGNVVSLWLKLIPNAGESLDVGVDGFCFAQFFTVRPVCLSVVSLRGLCICGFGFMLFTRKLLPVFAKPLRPDMAAKPGLSCANKFNGIEVSTRCLFSGGPPNRFVLPSNLSVKGSPPIFSAAAWRDINRNLSSFLHQPRNVDSGTPISRATEAFDSPSCIR